MYASAFVFERLARYIFCPRTLRGFGLSLLHSWWVAKLAFMRGTESNFPELPLPKPRLITEVDLEKPKTRWAPWKQFNESSSQGLQSVSLKACVSGMAISSQCPQCLLQPNWRAIVAGTEFSIRIFCPVTLFSATLSRRIYIKIQEWRLGRQTKHLYSGMSTYM